MLVKRLTHRAFWRITVQVRCLRLWHAVADRAELLGLALRRLTQPLPPAPPGRPRTRRRGPVFAAPDRDDRSARWAALAAQLGLLRRILWARARKALFPRGAGFQRFPMSLAGYLLLAFALEYVFLLACLPGPEPVAPAPGHAAHDLAANIDPAYSLEIGSMMADLLGTPLPGIATRLVPSDAPPDLLPGVTDPVDELLLAGPAYPALPGLETAEAEDDAGPDGLDDLDDPSSVRMAVVRWRVRMPVDPEAFHPLDKESLMAVAGNVLPRMFARVRAADVKPVKPEPTAVALAGPAPRVNARKARRPTGLLSARFESGQGGVYAIGYDPKGGTSYGKYQMSSRKGTMAMFIRYLDKRMPQWAERLRQAGRSNTLSCGGAMPATWRKIARGNPTLFETLQDDFIHRTFYSPTVAAVARDTGLDLAHRPAAVREVLLSTAVQHGPQAGARIVIAAARIAGKPSGSQFDRSLVKEIFKEREKRIVERALPAVRPALKRRLRAEMSLAMAMLDGSAKEAHLF